MAAMIPFLAVTYFVFVAHASDPECKLDSLSLLQVVASSLRAATTPAVPEYELSDGAKIPAIGFGTYRIPPGDGTYDAVTLALQAGYRMFDTAELYANEADVGRAIRDSGILRQSIFVTTKVFDTHHGYGEALEAGRKSAAALALGYIDCLLMHSPSTGKIVETYDAMLQLQQEGVVRSVGVSNFGVAHLRALGDYCRPAPVINQFELHPLIYDERKDVVDYCRAHGILVQPYGSVLDGQPQLLALAGSIAAAHNKTSAQVMLRWALDQGFQVIPKTTHQSRMKENIDVFDFHLTEAEIGELNTINGSLDAYWDPLDMPVEVGDVGPPPGTCP